MATVAAAPVFAASPQCQRQTVNWATYAPNSQQGATVTATGAQAAPISVTTNGTGNTTAANNLTARNTQQGAVTGYLALTLPAGTSQVQTVTFTFSSAVTDLRFSLLDIDSASSTTNGTTTVAYYDSVQPSTGFTFTRPTGSTVTGSGTAAAPFIQPNNNTPVDPSSNAGNVDLVYAGPTTSVSIRYAQQGGSNSTVPVIGISNLSFLRSGC
ncbi:hypothetical protein [Marmoricola endophyticus]|uniref:hypothetical protein n=1 Tax=Marmoricola endophyticus TaxID=2040280 RepID=UPI00166403AD|nr:hypothetical protein [Marmoricola endophyticus]